MTTRDGAGYVTNSEETYRRLAADLTMGAVAVNWTDTYYTAYAMVLAIPHSVHNQGNFGPMHPSLILQGVLFVSILGIGAAGFPLQFEPYHRDYIAQKLFRKEEAGPTEGAVADLINGVMVKCLERE